MKFKTFKIMKIQMNATDITVWTFDAPRSFGTVHFWVFAMATRQLIKVNKHGQGNDYVWDITYASKTKGAKVIRNILTQKEVLFVIFKSYEKEYL